MVRVTQEDELFQIEKYGEVSGAKFMGHARSEKEHQAEKKTSRNKALNRA